ncbi:MAG: class I SAM-dependent methyltransferase [Candidatus Thorarchaeota archaeon]
MNEFEDFFTIGPLSIDISKTKLDGRILDLGGGGEGVIGLFKGNKVVAIDKNKRELEEAPSFEDLKIVMDAIDLKFLDKMFETVTTFFTLMYIPKQNHRKVFQEVKRVLKKDGEFVLWDVKIPNRSGDKRNKFLIWLEIKINDKIIETGYGSKWDKVQDIKYFSNLGKSVGFEIIDSKEEENTFYLRFRKN